MDRQQQKTERLPPVIPAADMRLLVGDYIRQSAAVHGIRKIDFWLDDPQYERRAGIFALIDIIPQNHGFADSAAQTPIAYGGIKEKRGGSGEPDRRHDRDPYLQRIGARARRGRKRMVNDRVDDLIEGGNARLNGRRRLHHNARADRFRARDQAQSALDRKREDQPHGDNAPEQNIHPLVGARKCYLKIGIVEQSAMPFLLARFRPVRQRPAHRPAIRPGFPHHRGSYSISVYAVCGDRTHPL